MEDAKTWAQKYGYTTFMAAVTIGGVLWAGGALQQRIEHVEQRQRDATLWVETLIDMRARVAVLEGQIQRLESEHNATKERVYFNNP